MTLLKEELEDQVQLRFHDDILTPQLNFISFGYLVIFVIVLPISVCCTQHAATSLLRRSREVRHIQIDVL